MSEENVEIILEAVDALNSRDPDDFIECFSPDVEWEETGDVLPGLRGIHHGKAEVRKWFVEAFLEPWESLHLDVEEITETSDGRVFLQCLLTARGRASGIETEIRTWQIFLLANGKIARRQLFWNRTEALEAAGLSE